MTIIISDYDFEETDDKAFVEVHVKGISANKADTYANGSYIKVNYPPHLFEADLCGEIDPEASTVFIGVHKVRFELVKVVPGLWGSLQPINMSKKDRRLRREAAFKKAIDYAEQAKRKIAEAKRAESNLLIKKQIEVEREARDNIEAMKAEEKKRALEFLSGLSMESLNGGERGLEEKSAKNEIEECMFDSNELFVGETQGKESQIGTGLTVDR
ncbi:Dynein assembly factor 4, axonemal [Dinochytrium kinnereticum]|nr:Dynein assembly factor 4, axonemal [Dinochytrium kinnereticum]